MATEPPRAGRRRGFLQVLSNIKDGESEPREANACNHTARQRRAGGGQEGAPALQRSPQRGSLPAVPCPTSLRVCPPPPPPRGWPLAPIAPGWSLALGCVCRAWRGTGLASLPGGTSQPGPWCSPSFFWCRCTSDKILRHGGNGAPASPAPRGPSHVDAPLSLLSPWPKFTKRVGLWQGTRCAAREHHPATAAATGWSLLTLSMLWSAFQSHNCQSSVLKYSLLSECEPGEDKTPFSAVLLQWFAGSCVLLPPHALPSRPAARALPRLGSPGLAGSPLRAANAGLRGRASTSRTGTHFFPAYNLL